MKKKLTTLLVLFTFISLLGIVFTQLFWVKKAVTLKEEQFDQSVKIGLKTVTNKLMELYNDSTLKKIKKEGPLCVIEKTDIRDIINSQVLDSLIQQEMGCFLISTDYEYAVINLYNNRFIMGAYQQYEGELLNSRHAVSLKSLYSPGNYILSVYFPYQKSIIIKRMIFWVILSAFFLLVVIVTFTITIYLFIKQKRLSEMKTDFVNNMTHEFKTPISTISLSSEMLLNPSVHGSPDKTKKYARVIYEENARLQGQVERILQIAILDKGQARIRLKEADIHKIIASAVENFTIVVQKRNGHISARLQAQNSIIYADRVHLMNIISNLLDNANKYTPENPEITVSTKNVKGGIQVNVHDNGIGISKENQKHVFKKLYRVPTGNIHNVKGFGLGLYYVKTIVELHGGHISLHSEPGRGSRFQIYFPFNTNKQQTNEEEDKDTYG